MKPTVRIDTTRWQKAAKELFETSSRECVDFTNGQALKVSIEAIRGTQKASKAEIERVLGSTGKKTITSVVKRGKNAGQTRTKSAGYSTIEDSLAKRILLKRKAETGDFGIKGKTLEDMISKFIASKVRSAGFIASGWIPARNKLFGVVRKKAGLATSVAGVRKYGKDKGAARPATFGLRSKIEAVIENTALLLRGRFPSKGGDPMPVAEQGLQKAFNVAALDMEKTLAKRLDPSFKKFERG